VSRDRIDVATAAEHWMPVVREWFTGPHVIGGRWCGDVKEASPDAERAGSVRDRLVTPP